MNTIIDFHFHSKITSSASFDSMEFLKKISEAKSQGLNALVLTEHCEAHDVLGAYAWLRHNFEYKSDCYELRNELAGFKVFTGLEIKTRKGVDIIVVSGRDTIENLIQSVHATNAKEKISLAQLNELCDKIKAESIIRILPHPFRVEQAILNVDKRFFGEFDAVELNAKDLEKFGREKCMKDVEQLAKELRLSIVAGSDTHQFFQAGTIRNVFQGVCNNVTELKQQIKQGNYEIKINLELETRVRVAQYIKKIKTDKE